MPPLSAAALPDGTREIRITDSYGMLAGREIPMLRLVEGPAGVDGELIVFWLETEPSRHLSEQGRCVPLSRTTKTCVVVDESDVDWNRVAADLDSLGAWTLKERCQAPGVLNVVMDAGDLLIERLDGEQFDSYSCNAPTHRTRTEAGRQSLALWNYVLSWRRGTRRAS